ncbi:MAG: cupin domain-containing protein [Gammaproteobacteria bacterium]
MPKTTQTYWNPLRPENRHHWKPVAGMKGQAEELTLAIDEESGDYTRLTRFLPGADTSPFGAKSHAYPEEIMIIEGRVFDAAFDCWLEAVDYASRAPGEVHGHFRTDTGCVVLEISSPGRQENASAAV